MAQHTRAGGTRHNVSNLKKKRDILYMEKLKARQMMTV